MPDERRAEVVRLIGAARRRIILSVFRCNDFEVLDALAEALKRGVQVDIVLTRRAKGWAAKLEDLWGVLAGMGAALHLYGDTVVKYHAKYLVVDDGPAMVASLNLTRKCFSETVDFIVTTYDPRVVASLTQLFELDRTEPGLPLPNRLSRRLIIGPERARARLTGLITQARRSLTIVDPKITDAAMIALLKAREADGVRVTLLGRGRYDGLKSHGKLMVIDDETAVVGGLSLSALSLDFRREVAILVEDAHCVERLGAYARTLAAASGDGNPVSEEVTP